MALGVLAGVLVVGGLIAGGLLLLTAGDDSPTGHRWDAYSVHKARLVVHYADSPCEPPRDSDVVETSARVEVTVWSEPPPDSCVDSTQFFDVRVDLDRPLGDRPVYDGACLADGGTDRECLRHPAAAAG